EGARGPGFGMADISRQVQGPDAGGLAEQAGAVVQQVLERLGMRRVEQGPCRVGTGGLLLEAVQPLAGEGMEGVADGGGGTAELAGDGRRGRAPGTGQQDLTTTDSEGVGGA